MAMMLHLQVPPTPHLQPLPPPSPSSGLLFRQKILYLENHLHLNSSKTLTLNPSLRSTTLSSIQSVVSYLSSYHITPLDSTRIFSMYPLLLTCHPPSHLHPIFHFLLHSANLLFPHLRLSVLRCPRLLVSDVSGQLRPSLYFLRRLGLRINPHTTLLLVSDVEKTLIPKMDYIQSLGFDYRETVKMVVRSPGLLTFSVERNFKPKVEFLVGEMGRDVREVKEFPQYFSCSLEGRIKPRHEMLVESGVRMGLAEMLKVSDGEFRERVLEKQLRVVGEKV